MGDRTSGVDMIYRFGNKEPSISKSAFIAETASIIGDVSIGDGSSVWFNSVIRGDRARISIGKNCSHGSIVHGKEIKNNALMGMNATILHGAQIGEYAIVGAGSLVPPNKKILANSVVMGVPCKEVRKTNGEDIEIIESTLRNYRKLTEEYLKMKG